MTGMIVRMISSGSVMVVLRKKITIRSLDGAEMISLGISGSTLITAKARRPKDIAMNRAAAQRRRIRPRSIRLYGSRKKPMSASESRDSPRDRRAASPGGSPKAPAGGPPAGSPPRLPPRR